MFNLWNNLCKNFMKLSWKVTEQTENEKKGISKTKNVSAKNVLKSEHAKTVSFIKKGKKSSSGNYRPVSKTSILCKMLEGFIRTELCKHLVDNKLLSVDQFGFCKGRSCLTQLLVTINELMGCLDKHVPVDAAYLDIKKAFDSVPHRRLLSKLSGYGISGHLLSWIEDFLSDRMQYVTVNGVSSEKVTVTSGAPQGSVLGPTRFIYYINDLPSIATTPIWVFWRYRQNHVRYHHSTVTSFKNRTSDRPLLWCVLHTTYWFWFTLSCKHSK